MLQWVVWLCKAHYCEKWTWVPRSLYADFGAKFDSFCFNVNSNTFKGLPVIKSRFWNTVLNAWIDNNCINVSNSPLCTLHNENTIHVGEVLHFKIESKEIYCLLVKLVTQIVPFFFSYQQICKILGASPSIMLEYKCCECCSVQIESEV